MLSTTEVLAHLAAYVLREVDLDSFEDWIVSNSWNVHQTSPENLQGLVFEIESRLAEHSGDHISEEALRKSLADLVSRIDLTIGDRTIGEHPPILRATTSSSHLTLPAGLQIRSVDIQSEVAFVSS